MLNVNKFERERERERESVGYNVSGNDLLTSREVIICGFLYRKLIETPILNN